MGHQRHAYDDGVPAAELASDCAAVESTMGFATSRPVEGRPAAAPSPSAPYLRVSEQAARLADGLHLHLE